MRESVSASVSTPTSTSARASVSASASASARAPVSASVSTPTSARASVSASVSASASASARAPVPVSASARAPVPVSASASALRYITTTEDNPGEGYELVKYPKQGEIYCAVYTKSLPNEFTGAIVTEYITGVYTRKIIGSQYNETFYADYIEGREVSGRLYGIPCAYSKIPADSVNETYIRRRYEHNGAEPIPVEGLKEPGNGYRRVMHPREGGVYCVFHSIEHDPYGRYVDYVFMRGPYGTIPGSYSEPSIPYIGSMMVSDVKLFGIPVSASADV